MIDDAVPVTQIARALDRYPAAAGSTLAADLAMRVQLEPFNAIATAA